jgi:iron complex outermembrane recepter protein
MRKFLASIIAVMICNVCIYAQTSIKGKVTDRNGQPLENVSVKEKGGTAGTTTDRDGNYSINASAANATLVFSGAGLTQQELAPSGGFADVSMANSTILLGAVEIVGTRSLKRSATETAVPVDIIPISRVVNSVGQVDLNQILQYVAPSFNSNRQSGCDGADHIDPASLRGLGPDQTLVLINGKRRHQSALINIFGTRGRGNSGTDLNSIPAAAIERIEILRDGAAAQYGSDAIAGVINIVLKSSVGKGTANVALSENITGYGSSLKSDKGKVLASRSDGFTSDVNVNYGFALKNNGFVNITADYMKRNKTYRPTFEPLYGSSIRRKAGDASLDNYGLFLNAGLPIKGSTSFYAFGGITHRKASAFAYTRAADDDRNVLGYPDGFDPVIGSKIDDRSFAFGIKTKFGAWNADFGASLGTNKMDYDVSNSLNATLGGNDSRQKTAFKCGGFQLSQSVFGAHLNRSLKVLEGLNIALGTEVRQDRYKIFAGEIGSYKSYEVMPDLQAGAQGFPGFQPTDEVNAQRVNWGTYADAELDVNKQWLFSTAVRVEKYSDFGWTANWKLAGRVKVTDKVSIRGSVSTGFRAPSLPQVYYSQTISNAINGNIFNEVYSPSTGALAKAIGLPALKQETSTNYTLGFTAKPIRNLTITVDGYIVNIKNRIVLTGAFGNDDDVIGGTITSLGAKSAKFFTNAVNTNTKGIDFVSTYSHRAGSGKLSYTFAANFNKLSIGTISTIPSLKGKEDIYFGVREQYFLQASAPPHKISFAVEYKINKLSANLRFTHFAGVKIINYKATGDDGEADAALAAGNNALWLQIVTDVYKPKLTTDLSFSYEASKNVSITVGGSNIFDVYPNHHDGGWTETGTMWDAVQMGMGGAMYFAKIGVKF